MSRTTPVTVRLQEGSKSQLERLARYSNATPSETGARLIEEGLRHEQFGFIDFRNSAVGRTAYLQGSRLSVWMVVSTHRSLGGDVAATAEHYSKPESLIVAALNYAKAFPDEIEPLIEDYEQTGFEELQRMLPQIELTSVKG